MSDEEKIWTLKFTDRELSVLAVALGAAKATFEHSPIYERIVGVRNAEIEALQKAIGKQIKAHQ